MAFHWPCHEASALACSVDGAGKTTTIEIMEGILEATSGEVRYPVRPSISVSARKPNSLPEDGPAGLSHGPSKHHSVPVASYARGLSVDESSGCAHWKSWQSVTIANCRADSSSDCFSPSRS